MLHMVLTFDMCSCLNEIYCKVYDSKRQIYHEQQRKIQYLIGLLFLLRENLKKYAKLVWRIIKHNLSINEQTTGLISHSTSNEINLTIPSKLS